MSVFFLTLAALVLYSSSKHFPRKLQVGITRYKKTSISVGGLTIFFGILWLAQSMQTATAIVVTFVILMTLFPLLIFSLTIFPRSWMGWVAVTSIIAFIDIVSYAS